VPDFHHGLLAIRVAREKLSAESPELDRIFERLQDRLAVLMLKERSR
jgi:hypothetical protein